MSEPQNDTSAAEGRSDSKALLADAMRTIREAGSARFSLDFENGVVLRSEHGGALIAGGYVRCAEAIIKLGS